MVDILLYWQHRYNFKSIRNRNGLYDKSTVATTDNPLPL